MKGHLPSRTVRITFRKNFSTFLREKNNLTIFGPVTVNRKVISEIPFATQDSILTNRLRLGFQALQAAGGLTCEITDLKSSCSTTLIFQKSDVASKFAENISVKTEQLKASFHTLKSLQTQVLGRRILLNLSFSSTIDESSPEVSKLLQTLQKDFVDQFETSVNQVETYENGKSISGEVVLPANIIKCILETDALSFAKEFEKVNNDINLQVSSGLLFRRIASSVIAGLEMNEKVQEFKASPVCRFALEPVSDSGDVKFRCFAPLVETANTAPMINSILELICASTLSAEVSMYANSKGVDRKIISNPSTTGKSKAPQKRTSLVSPPPPEAARGVSSMKQSQTEYQKPHNQAYFDLVAEKCANEYGEAWADPRLTVP